MNQTIRFIFTFVLLTFTLMKGQEQNKPNVNVIVLGQEGHGRAAITSVITKVLSEGGGAKFLPVTAIKRVTERKFLGIPIAMSSVEYETAQRHYTHVYLPKHSDCLKYMISNAGKVDGAILAVSGEEGPTSQTEVQVRLARLTGIKTIVVFLNVNNDSLSQHQLKAMEEKIRALLSSYDHSEYQAPVIVGSTEPVLTETDEKSKRRAVLALLDTMDSHIPDPSVPLREPFLMPIEDVFSISGGGTVVTGHVERGHVSTGDEVQIVGLRATAKRSVAGIEIFRKVVNLAEAGDNIGVLLKETKVKDVERGQVLATPGSIKAHRNFKAEVYILSGDDGGRQMPFSSDYRPQFYFRTTDVTGSVKLPEGTDMAIPGDYVAMDVELVTPVALDEGLQFAIREGGRSVAAGIVVEVLP